MKAQKYICDCGNVYIDINALDLCQLNKHGRKTNLEMAAPDLLEACKQIYDKLDHGSNGPFEDLSIEDQIRFEQMLKQAIAKAEGKDYEILMKIFLDRLKIV